MPRAQSMPRFYWLDLIRFLAALTVLLMHARGFAFVEFGSLPGDQRNGAVAVAFAATRIGKEAVIVFLVLSGFLVGGRAFERIADGSFSPLDYGIDRFTRIMLPFIPALALSAVAGVIVDQSLSIWHLVGNLLALQGVLVPPFAQNTPLWSLGYEMWFFVLAGCIGVAASHRRLHPASAAILMVFFVIFTRLSPTYLYCWLIGTFAYARRPERVSAWYLVSGIAFSLCGIIGTQLRTDSVSVPVESFRMFVPPLSASRLLIASGMALIIQQVIMIVPTRTLTMRLDSTGTKLAAFSYTLYLIHFPILRMLGHFGILRSTSLTLRSVGTYCFLVTTCLCAAWVMFWLFEKRTPELRQFIRALAARRARPVAVSLVSGH